MFDGEHPHRFRHYVYGCKDDEEDFFITTSLSEEGAREIASDHKKMFGERFSRYKITRTDEFLCYV